MKKPGQKRPVKSPPKPKHPNKLRLTDGEAIAAVPDYVPVLGEEDPGVGAEHLRDGEDDEEKEEGQESEQERGAKKRRRPRDDRDGN